MRHRSLTLSLLAGTALCLPLAAPAQETTALDEIVVYYGALSDTAIAARSYGRAYSVTTADQIATRGYQTVEQVLRDLPGVAFSATDTSLTETRIRGGETNMVTVLIDGVKASVGYNGAYSFSGFDASDIARVEVLRGPQSVIGGANAASGVISIVTKSGTAPGLHQQASLGAANNGGYHGAYAAQFVGERGKLAFSLSKDRDGGWDVSGDGGERDGKTTLTGSLKGEYEIMPGLSAGFVVRRMLQDYDYDGSPWSGATTLAGSVVDDPLNAGTRRESMGQLWVKADTFGGRLTHKLSWSATDQTNTSYDHYNWGSSSRDVSRYRALDYLATYALDAATVADARQTLSFALSDESQHFTSDYGYGANAYQRSTRSAALEYAADFANGLGLQAGVRRIDNEVFKDGTAWNLAASYLIPNSDFRLHGSIGRSIVNPDMYEQYGYVAGLYAGNPDLKPETVNGVDLGVEWALGERASVDVTLFRQRVTDRIVGAGTTSVNLAGTSTAKGVEIAARWQATAQIGLGLDYTYTDSDDGTGHALTRRPKHQIGVDATWTPASGRGSVTLAVTRTIGTWDNQYFGPTYPIDWTPTLAELPNYTLVNVSGRYAVNEQLDVVARVNNLLDQDYSQVWGYAGPGRTAYLGLEAKW